MWSGAVLSQITNFSLQFTNFLCVFSIGSDCGKLVDCGKLFDCGKLVDCGKPTDCGKLVDCGKSMKSLINQVYNYMHFLYSQACLIRENAKNGNF